MCEVKKFSLRGPEDKSKKKNKKNKTLLGLRLSCCDAADPDEL